MELSNTRLHRQPSVQLAQNFHLVWLDESIDKEKDDDCRNSIMKLRQIVNTFTDADECIDFITDVNDQHTFMIVSQELSQIIIPIVQDISQVNCVYIFCENKIQHEEWIQQSSKVKGVYTDIASICGTLKQVTQACDHNPLSISFVKTTDGASALSLNTFDQTFMYTQILKEILLTIDFEQSHINDFVTYYRAELAENTSELKTIDMIEKEYRQHEPIWWYTYPSFLYSMVNQALRLMEVDLIIKMGFFVRDLHQHIAKLHAEQFSGRNHPNSITVYRGQGLSLAVLDKLKETQGGLMSFNNFLSTSLDQEVSRAFAESIQDNSDLIGVLFEIEINPSIASSPFANVLGVSYYREEKEILFSMHSVFRIEQVQQIDGNKHIWQVDLKLTSDNDPQLHDLTKIMQEEIGESTGWHRLGQLMLKLGHLNEIEELYSILIEQKNHESEKAHLYQMLGTMYDKMGEYSKALSCYEKDLEISQKNLPVNHPLLAISYNNIGLMYNIMGEYSKALSNHEKALEIDQNNLSANPPGLTTSYNNIGLVYYNMGEYSKALSYYEKALEIQKKSLPENHPSFATSYNNLGGVYKNKREHSTALSYYEKALEIDQKLLPTNHQNLATSYSNIGGVYKNMGEYSKALSYYEKDLEISQKHLSTDHPLLATSYNNIGLVYKNMDEYSKALSYYEKALEIQQKRLPTNHPCLAILYNNIGMVYENTGDYLKALAHYERSLDIKQRSLPPNHPSIKNVKKSIELVKKKL